MHLTHEDLLDLAEGTRLESSAPHLTGCDECRRELAGLRAMLALASESAVPEPSPLFWDHLSARVRDDVAAERSIAGTGSRIAGWLSWKVALPVAACLVALLAVSVTWRRTPASTGNDAAAPAVSAADTLDSGLAMAPLGDDPSWTFVTGLAAELDWDAAVEAGIAPSGGVDRAVYDLSLEERRELQRLIQEEIERSRVASELKS